MGLVTLFTLRILYPNGNLDLTVNKRIVTDLDLLKPLNGLMHDLSDSVICNFFLIVRVHQSICHHLVDVDLYMFFTCLNVNKICLNHHCIPQNGSWFTGT